MEDLLTQTNYALDTFYLLVMGALVMLMVPGFAMLEAGLVRSKNTAEILLKNVALFGIACIMYLFCGYYIMYVGAVEGGILPDFGLWIGDENTVEDTLTSGGDISYSARSRYFFQVVFVATAMSIISGSVAERMKLWAFLGFAVVMTGLIYPLQGMWTWGGGWISAAGYFDFAGSGVVHLCAAAAALAGVILLGPRKGKYREDGSVNAFPGANLPLSTLGMFILWFGWFGFNGGSVFKTSDIDASNAVAQVFVNTNIAACGGLLAALLTAKLMFGKADLTMALNGALAGLVAITADPLSPMAQWAMLIGGFGGVLVVFSIVVLDKLKIDDPVGAISVHGVVGIWGVLAVVFNNADATISGQLVGILGIFGWVFIASLIVWGILRATIGIRVSEEEEYEGMDRAECGLDAYPEFVIAR